MINTEGLILLWYIYFVLHVFVREAEQEIVRQPLDCCDIHITGQIGIAFSLKASAGWDSRQLRY